MKPHKQRITIAEYCGTDIYIDDVFSERLPDYPNDLNAMHEAEKSLDKTLTLFYCGYLSSTTGSSKAPDFGWKNIHSTAAQKAEAFLKTIGKWEE
jgi:hypothetical protein